VSDRVYSVLYVEDNPNHYKILQRFIERSGLPISVDHVESAEECFAIFLKKNYDLLMLDYNLGGVSGIGILERLKDLDIMVPIVMVTQQKDPKIAIDAMKLGAVDFVMKSKESFRELPEKIVGYVSDYEGKLGSEQAYRLKRQSIIRMPKARQLLRLMIKTEEDSLRPSSKTLHFYEPDHTMYLDMSQESLDNVMRLLTMNKILLKKPVGVKATCPRCESDDVTTVPVCPLCGGRVFVKNAGASADPSKPYKCLDGCNQAFEEVGITYRCNKCTKEFSLGESWYKHTFEFTLNPQLRLEVEEQVNKAEELVQYERRSEDAEDQLETTKAMQEEIRDQLRALIVSKLKKDG
jgi:DNA-binding response OmpR family regulator/DNA-directed RNA polymerase subunit RPC12/RpoP